MMRAWTSALVIASLALGCKGPGSDKTKAEISESEARPVKVMTVTRSTVERVLRRTGEIRPEVEVKVFGQIPDRILDLRVEEGDRVTKGQVIAIIRSDALDATVAQAAAGLESARAQRDKVRDDLARARKLLESAVTSPAQVEALEKALAAADAQVRSLEAVVEQAATRQRQSTVRAPISGIIGTRYLSRGDLAMPQIPIVTIVQMDRVKVTLMATEFDLAAIEGGTPVEVRVAAYPGEVFRGEITRVGPVIDPMTRHAKVEILLDNPDHRLKPGMLAKVSVVLERKEGVVTAPLFSLILDAQPEPDGRPRYHAFVVQGDRARQRTVHAGLIQGDRVEILDGLQEGDLLVIRGQHLLTDGCLVEIVYRVGGRGEDGAGAAAERLVGRERGGGSEAVPAAGGARAGASGATGGAR